jgi:hypothetical protein
MAKQIQELEYRLTATDAGASKVFERASERAARIERQAISAGIRAEEAIRRSARDSRTLDPSQRNASDKTELADMAEYYRRAALEADKLYAVEQKRHRLSGLTQDQRNSLAASIRDSRRSSSQRRSAGDYSDLQDLGIRRVDMSKYQAGGPFDLAKHQAKLVQDMMKLGGAAIIANRAADALQRIPEEAEKYRDALKNGYTKTEAAGMTLANLVPAAGELAKGFRAAYDWLTDLAKSDLLKETEARQKEEKERAAALGEASQKRGLASREVTDEANRDIRRSRRGRMEDQNQAAHDQAVEDARAEYATTKARTDISPEAKEAARQRMVETEGAAFEELNKKRQAQETRRIEELAAFEIGAQEEIASLRRQADEEAMEREGRGHELRVKQINDEAEQQIRAAQERYQEFTAKHKDAASYGVTPELQERQIAGIRAVRDQRVAKEQQAAEREQQEAALAEAQRYAQESLEQAQEADAQWRRAGRIDGPRVYGAEQAMAGITGGEAGGDSLKAQQSMDKKMSESVTLLKQVVEQLRQQLQALNDPKRPLIVVSQGGA